MCVCYSNVLLQYSTVQYSVTVMCVCYCNVLLQYSRVKRYCYMCVTVMCCYSTVQYSTVQYSVTVMCVLL